MKLVVFDVDGTLVDSQHHIHEAMSLAFQDVGLTPVSHAQVLTIVGLSLPVAVAQLAPGQSCDLHDRIVHGYKDAFISARIREDAPFYPGALDCLDTLSAHDDIVLAVATGKARRGLDAMIATHGLHGRFVSLQTADGNPSKPHPGMLLAALAEAGVEAQDAVMVGDTTFDIEMAVAAGMQGYGVAWGYHSQAALTTAGATLIARDFDELTGRILGWAA